MHLPPQEADRFYGIWFPLLKFVNEQRRLSPGFPDEPRQGAVNPADAVALRDALWADDALRERFVRENPAGLAEADLALVASWQHRVAGSFFVERYLKKHTTFVTEGPPPRAYGVLGLVAPIEDILGPYVPIYVQMVLLPFEGKIIYDSLMAPYPVTFGGGIRSSLKDAYRDAQEREGIITSLPPDAGKSPADVRAGITERNTKLLTAFRRNLLKRGMTPRTAEQHVEALSDFATDYLLRSRPPRGLIQLQSQDVEEYVHGQGPGVNPVSFRHFVRFLRDTVRIRYELAEDLMDLLRQA